MRYADDMVLLTEEGDGMRAMMAKLKKYLEGKGLKVNVGKTEILSFSKGGRRKKLEIRRQGSGRGEGI